MLNINGLIENDKLEKNIIVFYNESARSRKEKHIIINFGKYSDLILDASIYNTRYYLDKEELIKIIDSINTEIKIHNIDRGGDFFYNIVFWDLIKKAGIKASSITKKYELNKI